jgi:two-component system cell cycle sensor histidine kinase/response regulator CckA
LSEAAQQVLQLEDRVRVISDVTRRFAEATTNYQRLLDSVAQSLAESVREACTVFLLTPDGAHLTVSSVHALDPQVLSDIRGSFTERVLPLESQVTLKHVISSGQPLLIPRMAERPDPEGAGKKWQRRGLHSALMVPVRVLGRPIGVLTLGRFQPESPPFELTDQVLAQTLADHAGLAIENARLYAAASDAQQSAQRAQAERDDNAARLQRTLDNMREGYTIMDRALRYVYVNRAGVEHTHLTREQLLGHSPLELYPGFEGSPIHQALQRALTEGQPQRVEEEFLHADGEQGYFELNIQPVPEGLVVMSVDQTERRRAENRRDSLAEQLRQAQKLEAVGRLAGGVAHDFNNVLSVILGYAEDLLSTFSPDDPRRQDMTEIQNAGQRAAALTRQLLLFSRQQVLEPKVLDLNDVLANMDRMIERLLGEQVELKLLPGARLGRVRADRGNIEQVIVNLVVNARDAMPGGGRVTIETTNVLADEAFAQQHLACKPGPYVRLAVTDTGTGMDAATRARIFEPFFSTKDQGKGTGLGLSTVFGIAQQSGGGVWVYSEPGHGSTFKVYLPRVDAEPDPIAPEPPVGDLLGTETVLLVEDEQAVREVARRILERHGYTVLVADSAPDAVRLCDEHSGTISLLITDVVMPQLSGGQLAQQALAKRPELKVLYVSGYTDGSIEAQGGLPPGVAFLQKPFTSELLASKVRSVLDRSPVSTRRP